MASIGTDDPEFMESVRSEIDKLGLVLGSFYDGLVADPTDRLPAYVSVTAGAGGNEACLWAAMLFRMYSMYAKRKGLEVSLSECQYNDPDGFKSFTLYVSGPGAFGAFRPEGGIHRLSRISPYGHSERHTSFCSVEVFPEASGRSVGIDLSDVEVSYCCGGGPGGQKINKTAMVARLRHVPTGIMVKCQATRSQSKNREMGMALLSSKISRMKEMEEERIKHEARKCKPKVGFGNRDRTYVLTQNPMVYDHRSGKKVCSVQDVLDGNLDILRG